MDPHSLELLSVSLVSLSRMNRSISSDKLDIQYETRFLVIYRNTCIREIRSFFWNFSMNVLCLFQALHCWDSNLLEQSQIP
jgi:hypothetical protein